MTDLVSGNNCHTSVIYSFLPTLLLKEEIIEDVKQSINELKDNNNNSQIHCSLDGGVGFLLSSIERVLTFGLKGIPF